MFLVFTESPSKSQKNKKMIIIKEKVKTKKNNEEEMYDKDKISLSLSAFCSDWWCLETLTEQPMLIGEWCCIHLLDTCSLSLFSSQI